VAEAHEAHPQHGDPLLRDDLLEWRLHPIG
jgi:hypothetical protein